MDRDVLAESVQKILRQDKRILERFWKYVDRKSKDECWNWKGKLYNGYGRFSMLKGMGAYRASWIINIGPIPGGLYVLHKCNSRACVNPNHLYLGTQSDNMRDMIVQGGGGVGRPSRLNSEDIRYIKELYSTGAFTHAFLAVMFGTKRVRITQIINSKD